MLDAESKENLTKEVITSLSKEIETITNNMMAFRTRIGFGVLVGPFFLLGSFVVGAKGQPISFNLGRLGYVALVVDLICFLGIGFIAAKIEEQAWEQCNTWRKLIEALRKDPSLEISAQKLCVPNRIRTGYLVGYFLLFLSVAAAAFIIKNAGTNPLPNSSEPVILRIEQPTPVQH